MAYQAMIFVRRKGAYGIGHIGWAFAIDGRTFNVGSVENHSGWLFTPAAKMGFWTLDTNDPITPMRARRYDEFKVIEVEKADPTYAQQIAAWVHQQAYDAFGRNCLDDTYDVLRAYGIQQLPVPAHLWEPNHWFNHVSGQHYHIDPDGVDATDEQHPSAHGVMLSDRDSLTLPPPDWRKPGTPEEADFQATLKTTPPMPMTRQNLPGHLVRALGILR